MENLETRFRSTTVDNRSTSAYRHIVGNSVYVASILTQATQTITGDWHEIAAIIRRKIGSNAVTQQGTYHEMRIPERDVTIRLGLIPSVTLSGYF